MVRLLVPEGEGQLALTRKRPWSLPAQADLVASPFRSSLAAVGFTGFLALCGRSSPGTFIRTVAIFSVADLSVTAAGLYSRRELNRGVFKMENIKPKPGKLWERTNYTSPEDRTMIGGAIGDIFDEPQQTKSSTQSPHGHESRSSLQAEANKYTVVQVEFKQSELAGPDIEAGYRAYKDSLDSRDEGSIRDWLERLQDLKKRVGIEIQFVWKHLAQREHEFYLHVKEDWVKDATRRELQLLNNMAADLVTRYAILEYHEKDAQKRLEQMKQTDPLSPAPITAYETPQHPTVVAQDDYKGLQIVTEQVRTNFSRQKELLAHLQQNNYYFMASHPDEGTPRSEHSKQLQRNSSDMYKNVVATGRLLEWLEEQEREADEQVKR
ncbi:hypothetical protein ACJQWK_05826 [Exserohilum turcicum]